MLKKSIFGVIALIAIIAFGLVACDNNPDDGIVTSVIIGDGPGVTPDSAFFGTWFNDESAKRVPGHQNYDANRTDHTITINESKFKLESTGDAWVEIDITKWIEDDNKYVHDERGKAVYPSGYLFAGTMTKKGFETNTKFSVFLHNNGNSLVVNGFENNVEVNVWNRIYTKQ